MGNQYSMKLAKFQRFFSEKPKFPPISLGLGGLKYYCADSINLLSYFPHFKGLWRD